MQSSQQEPPLITILPKSHKRGEAVLEAALKWLELKYYSSQFVGQFVEKTDVPILGTAKDGQLSYQLIWAINQELGRIQYHSDPGGGTLDLYNHPRHTAFLLKRQGPNEKRPRDCDDFAVYADALASVAGSIGGAWIWNLIAANQFRDLRWNHVILGARAVDRPGKIYVLDTCSAAWGKPHEFTGTQESVEKAVRDFFGSVYKDEKTGTPREYKYLIEVGNPFTERKY